GKLEIAINHGHFVPLRFGHAHARESAVNIPLSRGTPATPMAENVIVFRDSQNGGIIGKDSGTDTHARGDTGINYGAMRIDSFDFHNKYLQKLKFSAFPLVFALFYVWTVS